MTYLLGIDGGGTGCRAAVADMEGRILGTGRSGSANIMTDMNVARANIIEATTFALRDAGLDAAEIPSLDAVLGLAGANVGSNAADLRAVLPFRNASVHSDGFIALQGAIGDHDGTVVILGTGSAFITRAGGEVRFAGGWGFKVGDLGGGARLGRALLEETLLAHDGFHPSSDLTAKVMARFGGDPHAIVQFAHAATPSDFGALAPMIFDHADNGDAVAAGLLDAAVRQIEEGLATVMRPGAHRLALLGGLGPLYEPRLSPAYRARLHKPLNDALTGAVQLAVKQFALERIHG